MAHPTEVCGLDRVLLERLLPALLSAVALSGADADMRFSCLKVMSDLLALLLDLTADGNASLSGCLLKTQNYQASWCIIPQRSAELSQSKGL